MSVQSTKGIYQLNWCIHGGVLMMPLSLVDRMPACEAAELVDKAVRAATSDEVLHRMVQERLMLAERLIINQ